MACESHVLNEFVPTRGRGLKHQFSQEDVTAKTVRPHAGARIETCTIDWVIHGWVGSSPRGGAD